MNTSISNEQFLKELQLNKYFDLDKDFDFDIHKRVIYWGVKSLGEIDEISKEKETLYNNMYLHQFVIDLLNKITPRQLMNIFPISKEYDGHKYELKDYFYTMGKCKEHGLDKPIGNAFEFLWDYMNVYTGIFLVRYLSTLSDVRKLETGQGVMETYAAESGIKTYTKKQIDGKNVFVENLTINSKGEVI